MTENEKLENQGVEKEAGYVLIVSNLSFEQLNVTRTFLQLMGLNCGVESYHSLPH